MPGQQAKPASQAAAKPGDRIVMRAKTKRLAPSARAGVVVDVLDPSQPRYLVRWDDGRQTVIAPLPDSIRIERPATAKGGKKSKKAARKLAE